MSDLDPITYTVLRNRLWAINVEAALALQRVSGSPLATEAFDMNTSIMSSDGEVAFAGPYLLTGPMSHGMITRYIYKEYSENPGIRPGDMFLCNDPYVGAVHQNCVTLVGPIHHREEIIAWCGATLHVIDVGGAQTGQVGIGATSIYEEAPPIPPIKIVADDKLLKDVEAEYLRRSRTPQLNALDLRGKIAALNTIRQRFSDVIERYGLEAVTTTISRSIDNSVTHLRSRLADLPDVAFEHAAYLDVNQGEDVDLFAVRVRLEKTGDQLTLDFSGSSAQAGAVINCTRSNLLSAVMISILTCLLFDSQWCPAAVERVVRVVSTPGTVVDAEWPAGCSMATMAAGYAATTATAVVVGKLLGASETFRREAMAAWAGAVGSVDVFGLDQTGSPFGTVLLDTMASGAGARSWADGIDTGGFIQSMACAIANVEYYEARFPLLYLFRRQEPDTGGPGRQRGGVGVCYAVVPYGVDRLDEVIPHFMGTIAPESVGLAGGGPGATNQPLLIRASRTWETIRDGRIPTSYEELGGSISVLPGITHFPMESADVLVVITTGGGGWGDPTQRDPAAVARDVRAGLVSLDAASSLYGVAFDGAGRLDELQTERVRASLRKQRANAARLPTTERSEWTGPSAAGPVDDGLEIRLIDGERFLACRHCGDLHRCGTDYLSALPLAVRPMLPLPPGIPAAPTRRFASYESYCTKCLTLVDLERVPVEEL